MESIIFNLKTIIDKYVSLDENNILRETSLFHEIFNKSQIKKKMIIVNDGDKFRDKNEILKEALDFVNER